MEPYESTLRNSELAVSTRLAYIETLAAKYRIPKLELLMYTDPKEIAESVLLRLARKIAYIPGEETISIPEVKVPLIRVPDGPWQHFKEKYLARWLSVRYRTLQEPKTIARAATYEARAYLEGFDKFPENLGPFKVLWHEMT